MEAKPVVHLALKDRLPRLGTITLAVDNLGAAHPAAGAGGQKFVAELCGEGGGQAMEIQLQFPGNGPPLKVVQDPLLNAGFGVEEVFMSLDFCLSQAEALVILRQMLGLLDRIGCWSSAPGFSLLNVKRGGVFHFGAEELAFIRVEGTAHGYLGAYSSCQGV